MDSAVSLSLEFVKGHPVEGARLLEGLRDDQTAAFLEEIPPSVSAGIVGVMNPAAATSCLELMGTKVAAAIVAELPTGISARLLRRTGDAIQGAIQRELPPRVAEPLRRVLRYPEGSAGSLMDPNVVVAFEEDTVETVLETVRSRPDQTLDYVYVVNRQHRFVGVSRIQELMKAPPDARVSDIMRREIGRISPKMGRPGILTHPGWRNSHALPVVDETGVFLGAIGYLTLRRLQNDREPDTGSRIDGSAGAALGELYGIGLSGLLRWAASMMSREKS